MGLGFWSKLDPAGQTHAITFELPEEAHQHAASWDHQMNDLTTLPVVVDDGEPWASMLACVNAGAPGWLDFNTETQGTVQ